MMDMSEAGENDLRSTTEKEDRDIEILRARAEERRIRQETEQRRLEEEKARMEAERRAKDVRFLKLRFNTFSSS
jgi:hypothetical protein